MIVFDIIRLVRDHYAPAGTPIERYSLASKPIEELLHNLSENGIVINPGYSAKEVVYYIRKEQHNSLKQTAKVPLATAFPTNAGEKPLAFYLRDGKGLELTLLDYDHQTMEPSLGRIGGHVAGQFGIECVVVYNTKTASEKTIDNIKKALEKTYSQSQDNDFLESFRKSIEESLTDQ